MKGVAAISGAGRGGGQGNRLKYDEFCFKPIILLAAPFACEWWRMSCVGRLVQGALHTNVNTDVNVLVCRRALSACA